MSRIDAYLRAIENNTLDEYYETKRHSTRKLKKFTKGKTFEKGQGKYLGKAKQKI